MGYVEDRRTDQQRETLRYLVSARDTFLSGWGRAKGGASLAVWACSASDVEAVYRWVLSRPEMRHVSVDKDKLPRRRNVAHVSIYPVQAGHPALGGKA